jgi:hypothetical protein
VVFLARNWGMTEYTQNDIYGNTATAYLMIRSST